ncbi:MAG: heme ABC exporter ATP-binding protein CcmA [Bradyrhizobiaceae bacterium]|nr:heme ABC exporter ATP-binding protein CcmA [Bradyrhizobiaceae bacterium]
MQLVGSDLICVRGGRQVFAGISFAVRAGEVLVISGPNGAGKTSLLRMVAGLLRVEAGHIELAGGEPDRTVAEQAHFLGHQDALKPSLSVAENLQFWARYLGEAGVAEQSQITPSSSPGSGTARAERDEPKAVVVALAAVGLDELADLPAGYLSAGQRRRLSIARLLAIKRPIWLLDEPTAALDTAAQARLAEHMRMHVSGGGLILAATHGPLGIDANHELGLAPRS